MVKVYGIPNCDIIKKASSWLKNNDVVYEFHDYKKEGITVTKLKEWCGKMEWEKIFNKRSSTWKELAAATSVEVNNSKEAIAVMMKNTSIIKRPIIEVNGEVVIGFNENEYIQKLIKK